MKKQVHVVTPHEMQSAMDQMKYEIAQEFGVKLSGETASRDNGMVGGEIVKRLIEMGRTRM